MNKKYYRIGEVAEMLGVHEDTLRNWDEQGLVVADRVGTRKDRRYTAEHIRQIREQGLVSDLARRQQTNRDYSSYTKEQLIKELQLLKEQKKYGLVWEDKPEEVVERCKKEAPILKPAPKMSVKGKGDEQKHILIEGDNYHSLQVLNYTHKGKIDVIYIDPPYNTGNKDFIFDDSFVDREDTYRHSKWLSFMEKRLRLSKNLLSNKGVILVSIDDNEQANLKLLCDAIFGEESFVGQITWCTKNVARGVPTKNMLIKNVETILTYSMPNFVFAGVPRDEGDFIDGGDGRGLYRSESMKATGTRKNHFYIEDPKTGNKYYGNWAFSEDRIKEMITDDLIIFPNKKNGTPRQKKFIDSYVNENKCITSHLGLFSTERGTTDFYSRFGNIFNNPKPFNLMKFIITQSTEKESVILDFFAGSGTTGHAVMELNKEDGGNRQFILCTNNENNNGNGHGGIAEGVCQPRIKKVMKGYKKNGDGEKVEGLGGNLEYLKTDFVDVENISDVPDKKRLRFTHEAGYMIALKENAFTELEKNEWYQIFGDNNNKIVGIYFRENLEKLEDLEQKILDKEEVKLYIFSHGSSDDWKSDYAEYENVSVEDIPEPILRVYRGLNS